MSSCERKPVVLATVPYYLPGYKGGGKLIAMRNLVAALNDQFHFKVMTADRDLGDVRPYRGIAFNRWLGGERCEVFHLQRQSGWLRIVREQLAQTSYDILYLNTVFSRPFGIVPLLLRRFSAIAARPVVVAPRGEFASGALAIKSARKRAFLTLARRLGLFDGVVWQASGEQEACDIRNIAGADAQIILAPDPLSTEYRSWQPSRYRKERGRLDILFLARITPLKNLHLAIEAIRGLEGNIVFRIAGPVDDSQYWSRCRTRLASLGAHIQTDYLGPIATSEVSNCLGRHGLLLAPSASESFGFVIFEALLAGCPVLISDRTPWRNLAEKGIGWDLPLAHPDRIRAALQHCVAMDTRSHRALSNRARKFALGYMARDDSTARNAAMFHALLEKHPAALLSA
jgi:glycosyltransferase involved in cell wall biosynthesis